MDAEQRAATCHLQGLSQAQPGNAREDEQDHRGQHHAIPHDVHFIERDEFAEETGETGQEDAQMKMDHAFALFAKAGGGE